jgi:hypothetical protein
MPTPPDQIDRNLSQSSRINGPDTNAWQQFADARGGQTEQQRECRQRSLEMRPGDSPFGPSLPSTDWARRERDYRAVDNHDRHFGRPGGMTFSAGETIIDKGPKKGY